MRLPTCMYGLLFTLTGRLVMYIHLRLGDALIFEHRYLLISLRLVTYEMLLDLKRKPTTQRFIFERVKAGTAFK